MVYDLHVHLVFITKYRRGVITDRVTTSSISVGQKSASGAVPARSPHVRTNLSDAPAQARVHLPWGEELRGGAWELSDFITD